ncbi:MAG: complex I NDUFA9 subunit family protein, partial [Hyphomicrobium sp.]
MTDASESPNGQAARRITIFGGSGFIGRSIVQRLIHDGAVVRIAARHPEAAKDHLPRAMADKLETVRVDIQDEAGVAAAVRDADAVINLVAILYEKGRQSFKALHVDGARRVAAAARQAGCSRMIQMSALGASLDSESAYARTKAAGEKAVRDAFAEATIVRPSIVFGPEDDLFNKFAGIASMSPALPLIGGGRTRFQPVFVEDVAAAFAAILADPGRAGKTYELGGPQIYTFRELMELLLEQMGRRRLLVSLPFVAAEAQGYVLEWLPKPPLTRDQVVLLKSDNVLGGQEPGLRDLGI